MEEEREAGEAPRARAGHIKKRSLKNKALSVSFDEKDLQDFVTGFHKRKKKRRKEAKQKLEEAQRRKRIEARKKRKLEKEYVLYGGAPPVSSPGCDKGMDDLEQDDEENDHVPSLSGRVTYDNADLQVTVITTAISPEEDTPCKRPLAEKAFTSNGVDARKPSKVPPVKKKLLQRVAKPKSRRKPQSKRDKGKRRNQKP